MVFPYCLIMWSTCLCLLSIRIFFLVKPLFVCFAHFLNELIVFEMMSFESSPCTLSTRPLLDCKRFLPDCILSFHPLQWVFHKANVLHFISPVYHFFPISGLCFCVSSLRNLCLTLDLEDILLLRRGGFHVNILLEEGDYCQKDLKF